MHNMRKIFNNVRRKKVVAIILAVTMIFGTAITAQASWYGFVHNVNLTSQGYTYLYEADYEGANIGADVWTAVDPGFVAFDGLTYTLQIQKKGWWVWQWDTVATTKGVFGEQSSIYAYNVGDGRYRFVIYTNLDFTEGVYATKFESYSWD